MYRLIVLYTALSLCANAAFAGSSDALRTHPVAGLAMAGLVVYDRPLPVPSDLPFTDAAGREHRLADFRGKVLLVNFWATWCPPCRAEMPSLDALEAALGGPDFQVLTIASGRDPQSRIARFFESAGVTHLSRYQDAPRALARGLGIPALPVSVLIDRNGHEVARMIGPADWTGPEAQAAIRALIAAR